MIDEAKSDVIDLMNLLIANHHPDAVDAKIMLLMRYEWKPDKDGLVCPGITRKATQVEKHKLDYDIVIILNGDIWYQADNTRQRSAMLDARLTQIAIQTNKHGDHIYDKQGHPKFRIRKPEYSGFFDILHRYGLYSPIEHKLASFFEEIHNRGEKSLFMGDPNDVIEQ